MHTKGRFLFPLFSVVMALTFAVAACAPAVQPSPTARPTAPTPTAPPRPTATLAPGAPTTTPPPPPTVIPTQAPTATPLGASAKPAYGDILRWVPPGTAINFDVHTQVSGSTQQFVQPAYDGLVRVKAQPTWEVGPDLAKSWTVSKDGLTWTFVLREGVKFHDGSEMTSEDVAFSIMRVRDKDNKLTPTPIVKALFGFVDRVEAPDKYTVKIITNKPWASGLTSLSSGYARIVSKRVTEANNNSLAKVVIGTGPFMFKEYIPDIVGKMVRNPNYWNQGLPYLDGVQITIIADVQTRLAALRAGQIDIPYGAIDRRFKPGFQKDYPWLEFIVATTDPISGHQYVVNVTKPPFNDVRVRKAIRLAIDDREVAKLDNPTCRMLMRSPMGLTEWQLPQEVLAQRPENKTDNFPARIAEAKRLLAEAGYPNGFATTVMIGEGLVTNGAVGLGPDAWGILSSEQLKAIGIKAEVVVRQYPSEFNDWIISKRYDLSSYSISYQGYPDPDGMKNSWQTGAGRNYHGLADPTLDALLDAQSIILDKSERLKAVYDIQTKILDTYAGFYFPIEEPCVEGATTPRPVWVRDYFPKQGYDNYRMDVVWIDPILKAKYKR